MPRINSDTVIAVLLLLASGILMHDTFYFRETPLAIVSSAVWPRIVVGLLSVFSIVYLFQSLRRTPQRQDGEKPGLKDWVIANRNIFWCYGLFAAFLVTLPYLGMLIGGGAFVFAALTAMGQNAWRSHGVNAAIAIISMGAMWALFTFGLNVMLPQGEILRVF
jgi:putative tricarboxylic transport membrane protein